MFKEFKEFALKGNVIDMAVGVVIGGAFGKIVTSVVNDLIMPVFGFLTAGMDFKSLKMVLSPAELDAAGTVIRPEAAILYGNFIQNVVDFLIIAVSIFLAVKMLNKAKNAAEKAAAKNAVPSQEEGPAEEKQPTELEILAEIRDLLADGKDTLQN
ncbi:large-conductance mechanosensitive channel protein MscL [Bacilliculturomica massiliensis]|uniref:large-conductance mechanosensitive channel protein MscL n=1 Tax=Bacilliculturomica massiliensis TaxID=1917867 RepID=UPI00102FFDBD|nr:large-conductance mechanosensitive channel protein MscL [Bacilliculturomica massiliensis]